MAKQEHVSTLPARRTRWAWLVGTFCGIGWLRPGPGTYGSIATVLLWYGAARVLPAPPWAFAILTGLAAIGVIWIGIPASTLICRESGIKDPGFVVIDEVAGQLIALIAIPADWRHALLSLILFRAFDIIKPPPVKQFERLHEGLGIMVDDVAAGVLALAFAQIAHFFF